MFYEYIYIYINKYIYIYIYIYIFLYIYICYSVFDAMKSFMLFVCNLFFLYMQSQVET